MLESWNREGSEGTIEAHREIEETDHDTGKEEVCTFALALGCGL